MSSNINLHLKAPIYYFGTSIILASQPILSGPIIIHHLGMVQYSITQILQTYAMALIVLTNLGAIAAVPTLLQKGMTSTQIVKNIIILNISILTLATITFSIYGQRIADQIPIEINFRMITSLYAFSMANALYLVLFTIQQMKNNFIVIFISALITLLGFTIIFAYQALHAILTVYTRLDAATAGLVAAAAFLTYNLRYKSTGTAQSEKQLFLRKSLSYFPPVMGIFLLQNFDRLYLPKHIPLEELAPLNLSLQIGFGALLLSDALNKQQFSNVLNRTKITRRLIHSDVKASLNKSAFVILSTSTLSMLYFSSLFSTDQTDAMILTMLIIFILGQTPIYHCFQNYLYFFDATTSMSVTTYTALILYLVAVMSLSKQYSIHSVIYGLAIFNVVRILLSAYFAKLRLKSHV